ncbi:MAG TPA: RNA pseudouridine synthase [Candidatus Omnitrophica bacterium]|nr:RNA pseudouridine synthase [Candidatus Omnitrophota bacterium]
MKQRVSRKHKAQRRVIAHAQFQREQSKINNAAKAAAHSPYQKKLHAPDPVTKPRIIFEDSHLIVMDKPAGLLSQEDASGSPSMVDWLRVHFGRNYVGTIHRLDRNTSGIMIFAKRTKSASRLSEALRENKIRRTYLAWLHGNIRDPQKWVHWLLKDEDKNTVKVVSPRTHGAKEAILSLKPLRYAEKNGKKLTLAEIELETGRSHQIRVQCAVKGFPLAGDVKYGQPEDKTFSRPALHSASVSFPHPMTGEIRAYMAELPADLQLG